MKIPADPPVGHLIAYEYLWHSKEHVREDGEKVYPMAIILAKRDVGPTPLAYAVGVSHKPPLDHERALEIPRKLKRWLGLDEEPAWVYTDQVNILVWPGPDPRPGNWLSSLPSARDSCVVGQLPSNWFDTVVAHVAESYALKKVRTVKRAG
ncbi:hypothetical protein ACUSIJ_00860 [Pseudochelatococcus sp. B33]